MIIAALLCAIGIIIPMYAPKIVFPPASFTLASHVPIFLAMFISPFVAISVAIVTGFGFLFSGLPLIIVARALTHVVFAAIGSFVLKKNGNILKSVKSTAIFGFLISIIHAVCEVIVVTYFYWGNNVSNLYYDKGYLVSVVLLIGVGTLIHSLIDLSIATLVWNPIQHIVSIPVSARVLDKRS
jgi:niacin transporter